MNDKSVPGGKGSNWSDRGTASASPHVSRESNPDNGPLQKSLADQMTIEMGAKPTKDPKPGF